MQVLVVLAHPNEHSFNHAIARTVCETLKVNNHQVTFLDLYKEGFDPLLPASEFSKDTVLNQTIEHHCQILSGADGIVIVHPNWWGMPPAILTGWIDRVFRPGRAYRFVEGDSGKESQKACSKPGPLLYSIHPIQKRCGRCWCLEILSNGSGRAVFLSYAESTGCIGRCFG